MQYKGASGYRSFPRDIQSDWKPVLVFEKPGERRLGGQYPHDVVKAMARDVDNKERHRWGQDEGAFRELLAKFADPGMTICDPFVGGATRAAAARELGCSFVGCDIDEHCVATTWDAASASRLRRKAMQKSPSCRCWRPRGVIPAYAVGRPSRRTSVLSVS